MNSRMELDISYLFPDKKSVVEDSFTEEGDVMETVLAVSAICDRNAAASIRCHHGPIAYAEGGGVNGEFGGETGDT